ncbi:MAG: FAD-dependent oxidoreductase, partial [Proteobacteria bacterium]|nr:FAD-dependent oxidoreductase [Pseudomonadota bacterium]
MEQHLHIIGGGMAGSEAAWQAANAGIMVTI